VRRLISMGFKQNYIFESIYFTVIYLLINTATDYRSNTLLCSCCSSVLSFLHLHSFFFECTRGIDNNSYRFARRQKLEIKSLTVSEYSDCSKIQLERINGGWKSPESYQYKTIYYVQYVIMLIRVLYIKHIYYIVQHRAHIIVLYYMYIAAVDLRRVPKSLLSSPDPNTGCVHIFSTYLGTIIIF